MGIVDDEQNGCWQCNEAKCEQDFGQPLSLLAESEKRGNDGRMKLILSLAFALSLCSIVQARNVPDAPSSLPVGTVVTRHTPCLQHIQTGCEVQAKVSERYGILPFHIRRTPHTPKNSIRGGNRPQLPHVPAEMGQLR
jgi:hypothetical protein